MDSLKLTALKSLAKQRKVPGYSKMTKSQLIDILSSPPPFDQPIDDYEIDNEINNDNQSVFNQRIVVDKDVVNESVVNQSVVNQSVNHCKDGVCKLVLKDESTEKLNDVIDSLLASYRSIKIPDSICKRICKKTILSIAKDSNISNYQNFPSLDKLLVEIIVDDVSQLLRESVD
jgi:Rho termination factor, N-terminal domain